MTPEEFRAAGHALVDFIADYRARIERFPVMAQTQPGDIVRALPASPPNDPEPFDRILQDVDRVIVPGLTHWQHPRFFGYFPSNALLASVLGDYLSTGLGVIGLSWQSSPALTELEEVTTAWMRQMLGLSEAWSGVIQDTASTSTLVALLCARERATHNSFATGGFQSQQRALIVYATEHAHSSVEKAVLLAGFGREHLRRVPHDAEFAMRPDALEDMMRSDVEEGRIPCAVAATTGTTAVMSFDPIGRIAEVARPHGAWVHVDAAMAGAAMILPECRPLWEGVEGADSIVVNPHKWLGAAMDCSLYYVRSVEQLVRVMSTNPSYLQTSADARVKNYRDWGIPLGRRFRALKLWCLIREQGVSGLQQRLRRDVENARWLAEQVRQTPEWAVVAPVKLQTVCVRHQPAGLAGEALERHTQGWADRLNRSGHAYVTPALLAGRWMVRVSVGAEQTEFAHVSQVWDAIREAAEREP